MALIAKDIIETIQMIEKDNLDIRTTTMGISFLTVFHITRLLQRKKFMIK